MPTYADYYAQQYGQPAQAPQYGPLPPSMQALQPGAAAARPATPSPGRPTTPAPPVGGRATPQAPGTRRAPAPPPAAPPPLPVTYGPVNYGPDGRPIMGGLGPDGRPLPTAPTAQQELEARSPQPPPVQQAPNQARPGGQPTSPGAQPGTPQGLTPQQIVQQQYDREAAQRAQEAATGRAAQEAAAQQDAAQRAEERRWAEEDRIAAAQEAALARAAQEVAAREGRTWQSGEGAAERAAAAAENAAGRGFAGAESAAGRAFAGGESAAERAAKAAEAGADRTWQSGEAATERTFGAAREDLKHRTVRGEELEDEARQFERLPGLWGMFTGEGTGGTPASMAALTPGQSNPADLAFARAKDKIGLTKAAQLRDLRHHATAGGFAGSGDEVREMAGLLGEGGDRLADFAATQALDEAGRAYAVDDRNYAGALTKRGQNLSLAPSMMALTQSRGGRVY